MQVLGVTPAGQYQGELNGLVWRNGCRSVLLWGEEGGAVSRSTSLLSAVTLVAAVSIGALLNGPSATAELNADARSPKKGPTTPLAVVSGDPYTNRNTFHKTLVEPDSFSFGPTIVSTFQAGRAHTCGASNLGWSVSHDAGVTWNDGFLPGTTVHATPPGPWIRTTDPVVAYDAKHDTWLVEGLGFPGCHESRSVFVSRSTDGANSFDEPVVVGRPTSSQDFDKNWIACDNTPTSPFYGNCYTAWDDEAHNLRLYLSTSTDGGLTWNRADVRKDTHVFGGQPLVQPDGTVIMPIVQCCPDRIDSFISRDGGASYSGHGTDYSGPLAIRNVKASKVRGGLAVLIEPPIPSTDVDAAGKSYVVWYDCRFRDFGPNHRCAQNDVVMSTSTDGRHWSPVVRIPIDPRTSSVEHFLPAIAVDPDTSGASAHIGVLYYYYPQADCTLATCELSVGFVSSTDGGSSWTAPLQLAGPFNNTWLPLRGDGYFAGDYFAVSFVDGKAVPVFTVAAEGTCELGDITSCNVWIASATIPLVPGS